MEIIAIAISICTSLITVVGFLKMFKDMKDVKEELLLSKYRIMMWDEKNHRWVEMPKEAILAGKKLAEGRQGFGLIKNKQADHLLDRIEKLFYLWGKDEKPVMPVVKE